MADNVAEALVELRLGMDQLRRQLKEVPRAMSRTGQIAGRRLGKGISATGVAAATVAAQLIVGALKAGIMAGIKAIRASFRAGIQAVVTAANVQEMEAMFDQVFGNIAESAREWSKEYAGAISRSEYETRQMLGQLQNTFTALGFGSDRSFEFSQALTRLSYDLGAFRNEIPTDVLHNLNSALVGNHVAVRRFGVVLTEATLSQQLMKMGIEGGTQAATEQQKVMARLQLILDRTSAAHGHAQREAENLTSQWRALKARVYDLAVGVGRVLMPVATELVGMLRAQMPTIQGVAVAIAKALVPAIRGLVKWIKNTIPAVVSWIRAWYSAVKSVGIFTAGLKAVGGALKWVFKFLKRWYVWISVLREHWTDAIRLMLFTYLAKTSEMMDRAKHVFTKVIPDYASWFFRNWRDVMKDVGNVAYTIWQNLITNVRELWDGLLMFIVTGNYKATFTPLMDGFKSSVKEGLPGIWDEFEKSARTRRWEAVAAPLANKLGKAFAKKWREVNRELPKITEDEVGDPGKWLERITAPTREVAEGLSAAGKDAGKAKGRTGVAIADAFKRVQEAALRSDVDLKRNDLLSQQLAKLDQTTRYSRMMLDEMRRLNERAVEPESPAIGLRTGVI